MKDHFFQRLDSAKCVFSDLFQTFWRFKYGDRVTCGNVDQRFSVLGIEDTVNGFESLVIFVDFNSGKLGNEHPVNKILLIERKCPRGNEIHACRDIEFLQGESLSEGVRFYALNSFGKTDFFEFFSSLECVCADLTDGRGDNDFFQYIAVRIHQ